MFKNQLGCLHALTQCFVQDSCSIHTKTGFSLCCHFSANYTLLYGGAIEFIFQHIQRYLAKNEYREQEKVCPNVTASNHS